MLNSTAKEAKKEMPAIQTLIIKEPIDYKGIFNQLFVYLSHQHQNLNSISKALPLVQENTKPIPKKQLNTLLETLASDKTMRTALDEYTIESNRSFYKTNHHYFYFHALKGLLLIVLEQPEKAKISINIAKQFPETIGAMETDHLRSYANSCLQFCEPRSKRQVPAPLIPEQTIPSESKSLKVWVSKFARINLSKFTDEMLACYFIDPKHQTKGIEFAIWCWNMREPNSVAALINMTREMLSTIKAPVTMEYIKNLHKISTTNVKLPQTGRTQQGIPGEFRKEAVRFGLVPGISHSLDGLRNIQEWVEKQNTIYSSEEGLSKGICQLETNKLTLTANEVVIKCQIEALLTQYEKQIKSAKGNIRLVIKACATVAHELCLIHPFSDANLRVAQQLLNKLLLQNGLPATILSEPSMLDGLSPEELIDNILLGFSTLHTLTTKGHLLPPTAEIEQHKHHKHEEKHTKDSTPDVKQPEKAGRSKVVPRSLHFCMFSDNPTAQTVVTRKVIGLDGSTPSLNW